MAVGGTSVAAVVAVVEVVGVAVAAVVVVGNGDDGDSSCDRRMQLTKQSSARTEALQ